MPATVRGRTLNCTNRPGLISGDCDRLLAIFEIDDAMRRSVTIVAARIDRGPMLGLVKIAGGNT